MGHVRNYAMGDVVARYRRARGFNVLHPMGWDAFGLPAENAAIQNNVQSDEVDPCQYRVDAGAVAVNGPLDRLVARNRDVRSELLQASAETVPRFPRRGLVARKKSKVNWDPVDQTVLANEQVIDGRGWRSGAIGRAARTRAVVLQDHPTIPTTCSQALDRLDRWPEKVRLMQKNWIGALGRPSHSLRDRSSDARSASS